MRIATEWLSWGGIVLLALGGTAAGTLVLLDPQSRPRRLWAKYIAALDEECRFLFLRTNGAQIARKQLLIGIALVIIQLPFANFSDPFDLLYLVAPIPIAALIPMWWLQRQHGKRVLALELQLDSWLLILANALKATPSLGEAIRASTKIMRPPIGQELDLMLKEVQLGTPLDQAIQTMSRRIGNRTVAGALATILVGRQTGGDLPRILEESAATLREMQRLEGVVRTKTAEGKSQAYVLGVIPFVLIGAIQMIDPNWLVPLTETMAGFIVIVIATVLWISAIIAARKILAVDV